MDVVECCDCVDGTLGKPGCKVDNQCETRICEIDTYCCNNEWDKTCVEAAQNLCFLTSQTTAAIEPNAAAPIMQQDLMDVVWKRRRIYVFLTSQTTAAIEPNAAAPI